MNCSTYLDGWDWRELANAWNVYIPESYAGKDMYKYSEERRLELEAGIERKEQSNIMKQLDMQIDWSVNEYEDFNESDPLVWYIGIVLNNAWKYDLNGNSRVMRKMANDIRCFAEKLSKSKHSYLSPLWAGLSKIRNDETLLKIVSIDHPLIASMWD